MSHPSTYLFVPGSRPERFDKALASGAGVVILDLEDAVALAEKEFARKAISQWCVAHQPDLDRIAVRINSMDSDEHANDVEAISRAGVRHVMLPKAESADSIVRLAGSSHARMMILPLLESARGIREVDSIAAAPGVLRLAFGTLDYALDLNLQGDLTGAAGGFAVPASRIAIASRCAGLPPPIAGVTPDVNDDAALLADLRFARSHGFTAKMCIHPRQVSVVHDALLPSSDEVSWARRVLAAANGSTGAISVDGKMVDRPVLARAQTILDRLAAVQGDKQTTN